MPTNLEDADQNLMPRLRNHKPLADLEEPRDLANPDYGSEDLADSRSVRQRDSLTKSDASYNAASRRAVEGCNLGM